MLIPISHERATLLRWPIVTLTILGICFAVHLWSWPPPDDSSAGLDAVLYYLDKPYLDPGDEVLAGMPIRFVQQLQVAGELSPGSKPTAEQIREEQRILDQKIAVWLALRADQPLRRWGLVPADYVWVQLFTHAFFHIGWLHLLANMFILYLAAPPVEDLWGRPVFAVFYLVAAVVAGLSFAVKYPLTQVPLAGASGAIAAVMGVFLVRFWKVKIRFFYFLWMIRVYTGTFRASAWLMLPLWFGNEVFQAYVAHEMSSALPETSAGGGVAYLAHIGGFVFGVAVALGVRGLGLEEKMKGKIHDKIGLVERPVIEEAARARREGAPEEAMRLLTEELRERPSDRDTLLALWDAAIEAQQAPQAAPRLQHLIELELRDGDGELALQHWQELEARVPGAQVAPRLAALVAERCLAAGETTRAREAIGRTLTAAGPLPPVTGARLARKTAAIDAGLAAAIAQRVLAQPELEPELRADLESLVRAAPATPPAEAGTATAAAPEDSPPAPPAPAPSLELSLQPIAATLREVAAESLALTTAGGQAVLLRLDKVTGVAVAEIRANGELPFFLFDLLLDPADVPRQRLVRLDTRQFDPMALVENAATAPQALATLVGQLLAATGASLYPKELDPFSDQPFSSFASIDLYESELLRQLSGRSD